MSSLIFLNGDSPQKNSKFPFSNLIKPLITFKSPEKVSQYPDIVKLEWVHCGVFVKMVALHFSFLSNKNYMTINLYEKAPFYKTVVLFFKADYFAL